MLGFIEGMTQVRSLSVTSVASQNRVRGKTLDSMVALDFQTPKTLPTAVVAPRLDNMEMLVITSHLVNMPSMTIDEQKMFGSFILMNPSTYTGYLTKDAYYIVSFHERLHNL